MSDGTVGTRPELSVAVRLAEAVAEAKGVDVLSLDPLSKHVDLDALESLVDSVDEDLSVAFSVDGFHVEVRDDRTVFVE
jgi:hypothetical protein